MSRTDGNISHAEENPFNSSGRMSSFLEQQRAMLCSSDDNEMSFQSNCSFDHTSNGMGDGLLTSCYRTSSSSSSSVRVQSANCEGSFSSNASSPMIMGVSPARIVGFEPRSDGSGCQASFVPNPETNVRIGSGQIKRSLTIDPSNLSADDERRVCTRVHMLKPLEDIYSPSFNDISGDHRDQICRMFTSSPHTRSNPIPIPNARRC